MSSGSQSLMRFRNTWFKILPPRLFRVTWRVPHMETLFDLLGISTYLPCLEERSDHRLSAFGHARLCIRRVLFAWVQCNLLPTATTLLPQQSLGLTMTTRNDSDDKGLSILIGDSGGANGLSTATVLNQVMKIVQFEEGLPVPPLVEDYFDIVAGAGTGAIIMTLVGRLGMTTEQAIETFARLSREVFSDGKMFGMTAFKALKLEKTLKDIVRERTGNEDEPMLDQHVSSRKCNT
ncbi:hypothetical protein FS749_006990, partial [Ceratobasidium sp. UAMH 11750]